MDRWPKERAWKQANGANVDESIRRIERVKFGVCGSTAALCGMVKETEHQRQIDQEEAYSVTPLLRYSDQSVFDALFAILFNRGVNDA